MKIIFCHYGMIDGGDACGFTRSFNLAKGLVDNGNQVYFLTTQKSRYKFPYYIENRGGVIIISFFELVPQRFRKGGFGIISTILKCVFVLFNKADVVHSDTGHRPSSGLPCIVHRRLYKSKYFSEWWEHFGKGGIYDDMPIWYKATIGTYDNIFEIRNKKKADGCIPISAELKRRAVKHNISEDKILVLNGGSDIENINFIKSPDQSKIHFNIPNDQFTIGIIGINDEEFINHKLLFDSVMKLVRSKYKIHIIATGSVSKKIMDRFKLSETPNITVFGWLPYSEFSMLITSVDMFALIQKNNLRNISRFPNKLGDYFAVGRPILTNLVGEVKSYVKKYPFAFYPIKSNDLSQITKVIKQAYEDWIGGKIDNHLEIRKIAIENSWYERAKELNEFYYKLL